MTQSKLKVVVVKTEPRTFDYKDGGKGASAEFVVESADGSVFDASVASTPEKVGEHIKVLTAIKDAGEPVDFEYQESEYGLRVKQYPGKPTGGGGGGRGGKGGGDWETAAERAFTQERIAVSVAMKVAQEIAASAEDITTAEAAKVFVINSMPDLYGAILEQVPVKVPVAAPAAAPGTSADAIIKAAWPDTPPTQGPAGDDLTEARRRALAAYDGKVPDVVAEWTSRTGEEKRFSDFTVAELVDLLAWKV